MGTASRSATVFRLGGGAWTLTDKGRSLGAALSVHLVSDDLLDFSRKHRYASTSVSRSTSGGGSVDTFHSTIRYGGLELQLGLQATKRTAEVQGQTVELGDANVILVDQVDTAGGAQVVRTLRIDSAVPLSEEGHPRVEGMLRRSQEILSFLQCEAAMPDGKGLAMIDRICAQVLGRVPQ